jgi:hypothetical protein
MMNRNEGNMILEISEHDALRLLVLARREVGQAYGPWRPYWEHLAANIQQCIEHAALSATQSKLEVDQASPNQHRVELLT